MATGAGSLIGASLLTAGTSGGAAPFVGFLAVEGASSLGIGVALVITGLMTDPSESNDFVTNNIPTTGTNALSKSFSTVGQIVLSGYYLTEDLIDKKSHDTNNEKTANSEKKEEQKDKSTYEIPEIYYPYWEQK